MSTAIPPTPSTTHAIADKSTAQDLPKSTHHQGFLADLFFAGAARLATWITLSLLVGIILSLVWGALPAIRKFGLGFLIKSAWDPVMEDYGGWVMIYGTLATSFIALLIAPRAWTLLRETTVLPLMRHSAVWGEKCTSIARRW